MMPDLWNAQDSSQYSISGAPAVQSESALPQGVQYAPKTKEDYDKVPSGEMYLDPDGKIYRKRGATDVEGTRGIVT